MLPDMHRTIKYGSLDDLYRAVDRCNVIIKRDEEFPNTYYVGYARVGKQFLERFGSEIELRRKAGEITIAEELYKITGNKFTVLRSM